MSRPRIYREELERAVDEAIRLRAAKVGFYYQKPTEGEVIYRNADGLMSQIVSRLLRDYSVVRKPTTERTV